MHVAQKYEVPAELALLYEFLNSADLRSYVEKGERHLHSDELVTPAKLEAWMRGRGLLAKGETVSTADHRRALELRSAIRAFVQLPPENRSVDRTRANRLNLATEAYPLVVTVSRTGTLTLQPNSIAGGLGRVVAELFVLAETGRLDRLKMCSSNECQWVFFDRSKPGNRRWCSSSRCGNRQKTRTYRDRLRSGAATRKRPRAHRS